MQQNCDYISKIQNIKTPEHWLSSGSTEKPNDISKRNAIQVCEKIEKDYKVFPTAIASTIESGIFIVYRNYHYSIIIEAYNTGEIGLVINDEKKKEIILNKDIGFLSDLRVIANFLK